MSRKPDALERLERWMKQRQSRSVRFIGWASHFDEFWIGLEAGPISYATLGKTFSVAIHAALDRAGAPK